MKNITFYFLLAFAFMQIHSFGQTREVRDDANGDWSEQHVILFDTPEADMMVRAGDIDNLGFGWPEGFDPFSGNSSPQHSFPWDTDSTDAPGTDRIMVVTSYNGSPPSGSDGYTRSTSRPENLPRPIVLSYALDDMKLESAVLQIFVDDFQASMWKADYFVTVNGVDAPYVANIINTLKQAGPIGKIINIAIPQDYLYLLEQDSLSILFDDTITGAGDGHAVDFVKLLLNPKAFSYTAKVYGYVSDLNTGEPIENAIVTASGSSEILTDQEGYYIFNELPAGITQLHSTKFSYDTTSINIDVVSGDSVRRDFQLNEILDAEFTADSPVAPDVPHTVQFTDLTSMNPTTWSWDFGDGSTSEEQNPSHSYNEKGYYTVTLTASNDEETSTETKVNFIQIGITGVEEQSIISGVQVSPNPLTGTGTMRYSVKEGCRVNIEMVDFTGKVVKKLRNQQQPPGEYKITITTAGLNNGLYFIRLIAGREVFVKKILVLHD